MHDGRGWMTMETFVLDRIAEKIEAGVPLTGDDAEQLATTDNIVALGMLADKVRRRRHGDAVTFVRVAQVSLADAANARATWPIAAREIRLVDRPPSFEEARAAVRAIAVAASGVPLVGLSLGDLEKLADEDPARLQAELTHLREEGLEFLAEARVDELKDPGAALAAATAAGLPPVCFTVGSAPGDGALASLTRLADLLAAAPKTRAFAPLPREQGAEPTTGYEDVKAVALARILLPIDHVQVDWRVHGPKLAQVALTFGADDVHNVAAEDDVGSGWRRSPREEIIRNIRAAGYQPAERDGRFTAVD
jgi:aminodeoxyfutalosine synthase